MERPLGREAEFELQLLYFSESTSLCLARNYRLEGWGVLSASESWDTDCTIIYIFYYGPPTNQHKHAPHQQTLSRTT